MKDGRQVIKCLIHARAECDEVFADEITRVNTISMVEHMCLRHKIWYTVLTTDFDAWCEEIKVSEFLIIRKNSIKYFYEKVGFTMYLAIDGTQYQVRKIFHLFNLKNVFFQYIKIPNDGQKPFTFPCENFLTINAFLNAFERV